MKFVSAFFLIALVAQAAVYLEPNRGQAPRDVDYLARGKNGMVGVGATSIRFVGTSLEAIVFAGAKAVTAQPGSVLRGVSHYAPTAPGSQGLRDIPHFASVRYDGLYRGVDVVYRVARDQLEFDFLVAAGAEPGQIRLAVPTDAHLDESGELVLKQARLRAPVAWQTIDGKQVRVDVRFVARGEREIAFLLGRYDHARPLVIDPVVQSATYWGGTGSDVGLRVINGDDGAIFASGNTQSADFPADLQAESSLNRPQLLLLPTIYVTRFNSDLSAADWSFFVGGSGRQSLLDMRKDKLGNLYLLGTTTSPNFPVTSGAWRTTINSRLSDLFVMKLDGATGRVKASTFLGISVQPTIQEILYGRPESGARLAVDAVGGVYVAGTASATVVPTPGTIELKQPGSAFVLRLNSALSAVVYLARPINARINSMDVDGGGNLVLAGMAEVGLYNPFPAVNPLPGVNQAPDGLSQGFVARLNRTGSAFDFATLLHAEGRTSEVDDVKIGPDGSVHVVGTAEGAKFPLVNPINIEGLPALKPKGYSDTEGFLARLAPDGKSLLQSTQADLRLLPRLAFRPNGELCVAGLSFLPAQQTAGGLIGLTDPFFDQDGGGWSLACVDQASNRFAVRTLLPGGGSSLFNDVAALPDGSFLFTGTVVGSGLATTPGVVQPNFAGFSTQDGTYTYPGDGFLMRMSLENPAPEIRLASPDVFLLDTADTGTCVVILYGSGFRYGATVTLNGKPLAEPLTLRGQETVSFPCADLRPGDNHIAMTLPGPGGGMTDRIIQGVNAPPTVTTLSPSTVAAGSGETKVVIRATNLTANSTLTWNGKPRTALFVLDSATVRTGHFELILPPAELAQAAAIPVTVTNPGPGGGTSNTIAFLVQSAATPVAVLQAPFVPFYIGDQPLSSISLTATGITASTRINWDGVQVPVTAFTSSRVTFVPPSADLAQWGEHTVYAEEGSYRSPAVTVYLARGGTHTVTSAYDKTRNRLYRLVSTSANQPGSSIEVLDGETGALLRTNSNIVAGTVLLALSSDGKHLYTGARSTTGGTITQISTVTNEIEAQWHLPVLPSRGLGGPSSLASPSGSPETVIVSDLDGRIQIFDRGRERPFDSLQAGLPLNSGYNGYPILLASASRVYTGIRLPWYRPDQSCWLWADFDSYGFFSSQNQCSLEPPEAIHDAGAAYVGDDGNYFTYLVPAPPPINSAAPDQIYAVDLSRRRAWTLVQNGNGTQLYAYDMVQQKQTGSRQFYSNRGNSGMYPTPSGRLLLVLPDYAVLLR